MYVDDLIGGREEVNEAFQTCIESIKILKEAGMVLCKWKTNSRELISLMKENNIDCEQSDIRLQQYDSSSKVLGLIWDPGEDVFRFCMKELSRILTYRISTKRFVLQVVGRIYDPIGFLAPYIIIVKCILQEIWSSGVDWDEELPKPLDHRWQMWCDEVENLNSVKIPRYASVSAYGTVLYLRAVAQDDSTITLCWVKSNSCKYKQFVKNRVEEIQRLSDPNMWFHCPGKQNPGDIVSRGMYSADLAKNSLWWNGPPWLRQPSECWPNMSTEVKHDVRDLEFRKEFATTLFLIGSLPSLRLAPAHGQSSLFVVM
ncbi:uncharacterized protein LOC129230127 [Uloborus diversus]|uniref:uncharacterized protein LOC129230127 n=1 Tax=Uloborus diversus TaxID=327109 RepID=UPI002409EA0A|nr:uncharacterized protein LOC129230127 [Uloborus diversus]